MSNISDHWEIPAQRRARISELVNSRGAVSVPEIAGLLGISESTVRRDLHTLSESGLVKRSYGGAVSVEYTTHEPLFSERLHHNREEKLRIGREAIKFIEPGQSVIFDSSSTVLAAVEALRENPVPITAVTNDLRVATELTSIPNVDVLVTGGEVRTGSFTLWGTYAQGLLKNIHADLALMGIHAITGITLSDTSMRVAAMKKAILAAAHRIVLLADHSKFGPPTFVEVCNLQSVHDIVTDPLTSRSALEVVARDSKRTQIHLA